MWYLSEKLENNVNFYSDGAIMTRFEPEQHPENFSTINIQKTN